MVVVGAAINQGVVERVILYGQNVRSILIFIGLNTIIIATTLTQGITVADVVLQLIQV
jgi:hypothetical protein